MSIIRDAQEGNQPTRRVAVPRMVRQPRPMAQPTQEYSPPTADQIPGLIQPELPADAGAIPPLDEALTTAPDIQGIPLTIPEMSPMPEMPDSVRNVLNPELLFGGPTPEQRLRNTIPSLPTVNYTPNIDQVLEQLNIDRTPRSLNSTRNPFSTYGRGLLGRIGEYFFPSDPGNLTDTVGLLGNNFGDYGTGALGRFFYILDNIQNTVRGLSADIGRGLAANLDFIQRRDGQPFNIRQGIELFTQGPLFFNIPEQTPERQAARAEFYQLTEDGTHMPYVIRALTGQDLSPLNWSVDDDGSFNPFGALGDIREPVSLQDFILRFTLGLATDVALDPTNTISDYFGTLRRRQVQNTADNTLPPPETIPPVERGTALPGAPERPQLPPARPNWQWGIPGGGLAPDGRTQVPEFQVDENGIRYRPIPVPNIPRTQTVEVPVVDGRLPNRVYVPETVEVTPNTRRLYSPQPSLPDLVEAVTRGENVDPGFIRQVPRLTSDNIRLLNSYEPIIPNSPSITGTDITRILDSMTDAATAEYYRSLIPDIGVVVPEQSIPTLPASVVQTIESNRQRLDLLRSDGVLQGGDTVVRDELDYLFYTGDRVDGYVSLNAVDDSIRVSFTVDNSFTRGDIDFDAGMPVRELGMLRRNWDAFISSPRMQGVRITTEIIADDLNELVSKSTLAESLGFRAYNPATDEIITVEEAARQQVFDNTKRALQGDDDVAINPILMRLDTSVIPRMSRSRIDVNQLIQTVTRPIGDYTRSLLSEYRQPWSNPESVVERVLHPNLLDNRALDEVAQTLPDEIRPVDVPAASIDYRAELRQLEDLSGQLDDAFRRFNEVYDQYQQIKEVENTVPQVAPREEFLSPDEIMARMLKQRRNRSRRGEAELTQLLNRYDIDDVEVYNEVFNTDEYEQLVRDTVDEFFEDGEDLADLILDYHRTRSRSAERDLNEYLVDNDLDDTEVQEAILDSEIFQDLLRREIETSMEGSDLVMRALNRFSSEPTASNFDGLRNQLVDTMEEQLQQLRREVVQMYDEYLRKYDSVRGAAEVERVQQIEQRMSDMRQQVSDMTEQLGQGNRQPCL